MIIKTDTELLNKIAEARRLTMQLGNALDLINEAEVMEEEQSEVTRLALHDLLQAIDYDIIEHDLVG